MSAPRARRAPSFVHIEGAHPHDVATVIARSASQFAQAPLRMPRWPGSGFPPLRHRSASIIPGRVYTAQALTQAHSSSYDRPALTKREG